MGNFFSTSAAEPSSSPPSQALITLNDGTVVDIYILIVAIMCIQLKKELSDEQLTWLRSPIGQSVIRSLIHDARSPVSSVSDPSMQSPPETVRLTGPQPPPQPLNFAPVAPTQANNGHPSAPLPARVLPPRQPAVVSQWLNSALEHKNCSSLDRDGKKDLTGLIQTFYQRVTEHERSEGLAPASTLTAIFIGVFRGHHNYSKKNNRFNVLQAFVNWFLKDFGASLKPSARQTLVDLLQENDARRNQHGS